MKKIKNLLDIDDPLVRQTAERLTAGQTTLRGKLELIFHYVRDEIIFGFPPHGDLTPASETIRLGMGQCNTKGALFLALCRAVGIPARMHFSLIKKEIQRGLFSGPAYLLMPKHLSHSWLEVRVGGRWRRIDSYINDQDFYLAGKRELARRGWDTGYSVSCAGGQSSSDLNLDQEAFVQMGAVVADHGGWDDPAAYYVTDQYRNRPNPVTLLFYRLLVGVINRRVARLRKQCAGGLCGQPVSVNS